MEKENNSLKIYNGFKKFEQIVAFILSVIIGLIIVISLLRLSVDFYQLFVLDVFTPTNISFQDYQQLFGKIMTLLISLEFMSSIMKILKTHKINSLILDVVLISALAISRKLIIYDYEHHDPTSIMAMGVLLVSTGIAYFLFKFNRKHAEE